MEIGTYGFRVLFEFDKIIWEDRIEIILCISWQLEFFLVGVFWLLSLSFHELSLALLASLIFAEEGIILKKI